MYGVFPPLGVAVSVSLHPVANTKSNTAGCVMVKAEEDTLQPPLVTVKMYCPTVKLLIDSVEAVKPPPTFVQA